MRPGAAQWDPTKPAGLRQQAPLTPEYQRVFENNLAITASGGQEYNPQVICLPSGMPRVMIAYEPLEIIITPAVTYIRFDQMGENLGVERAPIEVREAAVVLRKGKHVLLVQRPATGRWARAWCTRPSTSPRSGIFPC